MAQPFHDSADLAQLEGPRSYRVHKIFLVLGIVGVVLFGTAGLVSTLAAATNVDGSFGRPATAAVIFASFWSCLTILSVWLILEYRRSRLLISAEAVSKTGVFGTQTLLWSEITAAQWRTIPQGGKLVLHGPGGKVSIEFAAYQWDRDLHPIHFFRRALADNLQHGWTEFESRFVNRRPAGNPFMFMLVTGLLLSGLTIAFVVVWAVGAGDHYLALSIVNAVSAVFTLAVAWIAWKRRPGQRRTSQQSNCERHS